MTLKRRETKMLNWFSSLELNGVESVACSLLVSAVLCSAIIFLCIMVGSFIKSLTVRYWLIFSGQLSCLALFVGCLVSFYNRGVTVDTEGEILLNKSRAINLEQMIPAAETDTTGNSIAKSNKIGDLENKEDIVNLDQMSTEQKPKGLVLELKSTETINTEKKLIDQTITMAISTILKNSNIIVWIWALGVASMFLRWLLGAYGLLQLKRSGMDAPNNLISVFSKLSPLLLSAQW